MAVPLDDHEPCWHAFRSYNAQALYGYGTSAEASAYADHLNRGREINLYAASGLDADEAEGLDLERRDDAFSLPESLAELDEAAPTPN